MTMSTYPRTLQTTLDDTIGRRREGGFHLNHVGQRTTYPPHTVGTARLGRKAPEPVYGGRGLGPNLRKISWRKRYFWVLANSVFSPGEALIRRARYHELLAVWDYKGKHEMREWSRRQKDWIMGARFASPPAKIVCLLLFGTCSMHLPFGTRAQPIEDICPPGMTKEVPFSPLELNATTRVEASQADSAEVDLTPWELPNETPRQPRARQVIRRLAH